MKKFKILPIFIALGFWGAQASADENKSGLFVEPGVTYEVGSADGNFPNVNSKPDADGLGLMARVGFHISEAFFAGIDGRYSKLTVKDNNATFNYDAKGSAYNWGPVVGVQMPVAGLRVWANYILDSKIDPDADNGLDLSFDKGKGYRIGAGFHIAMVSLNIEYQDLKYDTVSLQAIGPFAPGTSFNGVELKNKSWIASVSFPLEL